MKREIRCYIDHVRGAHVLYKNKDSFCRHVPTQQRSGSAKPNNMAVEIGWKETQDNYGHLKNLGKGSLQNDSRFLNITQDTPRCSNKNLYKMSLWKNIYEISPSSIQKWSLQNERTQAHLLGKTLPGTE